MPATLKPLLLDELIRARRRQLAEEAARVYAQTKSLRKTAVLLDVSHETVRALVRESESEAA